MSKVDIIKFAKSVKKKIKKKKAPYISYCRRIERVKTDKRICAMTFDDGPTYASNITKTLVDILNNYGAVGTFDVIGTTEHNYPDEEGTLGTPSWSGTYFDHYPGFGDDKYGGAVNCPELIDMIIASGHEITNHTFSHILFGKKNIIYSKRNTLNGFDAVFDDISKLHEELKDKHGYTMKFSRPPHYVDKIKDGLTSYDVYSKIGYNYLAASFDGAGWLPCLSDEEEIDAMTAPLLNALQSDPDSLCGQIIFQKDGFNMAKRAPVMKGLDRQLEVLSKYGYKVVGVSELMDETPFEDIGPNDPDFQLFKELAKKHAIVYNNNTLQLDKAMNLGELAMLIAPKSASVDMRIDYIKNKASLPHRLKSSHPYSGAIVWCVENGFIKQNNCKPSRLIQIQDIVACKEYFKSIDITPLTRREVYKNFKI